VCKTWYGRIDSFLSSLGVTKSKADSNLFYKVEEGNPVILLLYADNLFVTGKDRLIADTQRKLSSKFEMKNLGMMHYLFLAWRCGRVHMESSLDKGSM
jgi:hypothetical protein